MKAVILTRISSKEQREGHSLEAQRKNLELYADRSGLKVLNCFTLIESSTKRKRPEFDKMIKFIRQQKSRIALIVDTVDRLQRSFRETPVFNDLMQQDMIELHFVKEGNVLTKDATSTQKLMWNMGVVMAQSYTDQLSDNVKRSMRFKVQNGECCGRAPIGYLNAKDPLTNKATVVIDSKDGDLVRQLFELYSKGKISVSELRRHADDIGLRTRTGNKLCLQQVHNIIQNSFYCGVMRVKGHTHPHQYETIISKALFDKCQDIRLNKGYRKAEEKSQHQFLFEGLLRCHASTRLITCDLKKKQYVYLICREMIFQRNYGSMKISS